MQSYDFSKIPGFHMVSLRDEEKRKSVLRAMDILVHQQHHIPLNILFFLNGNGIALGESTFIMIALEPLQANEDDFPILEVLLNLEELIRAAFESNCVYVFQNGSRVIALSCSPRLRPGDGLEPTILEYIIQTTRGVIDSCRSHVGFPVAAVVSAPEFGSDSIPQLLVSVTDTLDYNRYTMNFKDISSPAHKMDCLDMFLKDELIDKIARQIANYISVKNYESAKNEVNMFVLSLLESKTASLRDLHFSLLLFVNSFSKELLKLEISDVHFLRKNNLLETLYAAENIKELAEALNEIIDSIRLYCEKREKSQITAMMEDCKHYVQEHFTDPGLSVAGIANQFGVNQTALSNRFKIKYGQDIGSFIRKYRVGCAKELLQAGIGLDQVAAQSGFGSINTMYRAFKREEGVPPGKFR